MDVITLDGLRVEYAYGFGLARPQQHHASDRVRFEADSKNGLQLLQNDFSRIFQQAAPHQELPFNAAACMAFY